jgi:hypothetical protein
MTIDAVVPMIAAPAARAAAWLPADIVTTPLASSSGDSKSSVLRTPRILKDPVRWNSSALSHISRPSSAPMVRAEIVGVWCARSPTRR